MEIDRNAPVVARAELQIAADPEKVWEVLTGFEDWPSWNPDTSSVALEGDVVEGSVFRWKAGSARITSTLRRVERPRVVGWTGKTTGIRAAHVWELEPADGGTLVRTEESFDGVLARLLRRRLQRSLDRGLAEALSHLKAEAERRTRPG